LPDFRFASEPLAISQVSAGDVAATWKVITHQTRVAAPKTDDVSAAMMVHSQQNLERAAVTGGAA
jgi:hypothetical protein